MKKTEKNGQKNLLRIDSVASMVEIGFWGKNKELFSLTLKRAKTEMVRNTPLGTENRKKKRKKRGFLAFFGLFWPFLAFFAFLYLFFSEKNGKNGKRLFFINKKNTKMQKAGILRFLIRY